MKISIDTYDLAVCVALWGGFVYGEWIPASVLIVWLIIAEYIETEKKVDAWITKHKLNYN
jgi:phage-related holin